MIKLSQQLQSKVAQINHGAYTAKELSQLLDVSVQYIHKIKAGLATLGIIVKAAVKTKPNSVRSKLKIASIKHAERMRLKNYTIDDVTFTEHWGFKQGIQARFLICKLMVEFKGNVPFNLIGDKYYQITAEEYAVLESKYIKWINKRIAHPSPSSGSPIEQARIAVLYKTLSKLYKDIKANKKGVYTGNPSTVCAYIKRILDSFEALGKRVEDPELIKQIHELAAIEIDGLVPTDEQVQAVAKLVTVVDGGYDTKERVVRSASIQSWAGASKTTTATLAQTVIRHRTGNVPYIAATTNKSIRHLNNSITIAKFLQNIAGIRISDNFEVRKLKAETIRNTPNMVDVVIVDESSQVGNDTRDILECLSKRVLYFGDACQLAPVEGSKGVDVMFLHTLIKQYRFLNSEDDFQRDISKYTNLKLRAEVKKLYASKVIGKIRAKHQYVEVAKDAINKLGISSEMNWLDSVIEQRDVLSKYLDDDSQIIAGTNACVDGINEVVNGGAEFKIGSKVMLKSNLYDLGQYNGFQYRVIDIKDHDDVYTCKSLQKVGSSKQYEVINLSKKDLVLAYAITTYTSQGSEWKNVLGVTNTIPDSFSEDTYVIATRASYSIRFIHALAPKELNEVVVKDKEAEDSKTEPKVTKALLVGRMKASEEGCRNQTLYGCVKDAVKNGIATNDVIVSIRDVALNKGLEPSEVESTINSAYKSFNKPSTDKDVISNNSTHTYTSTSKEIVLNELPFNPDKTLTYEVINTLNGKRVQRALPSLPPSLVAHRLVAWQLKDTKYCVIDCDNKATVDAFRDIIDSNHAWVSKEGDKAHIVFTTDRVIPNKRYHKGDVQVDILGNGVDQLRFLKSNKDWNGLEFNTLTQSVIDRLNTLTSV